jgi:hypothetical protein
MRFNVRVMLLWMGYVAVVAAIIPAVLDRTDHARPWVLFVFLFAITFLLIYQSARMK